MSDRETRNQGRGSTARFDAAVDGAVREMLDVEQPAGFRARVLRKIEGEESRTIGRKILWLALPLAAAAVVILAVLLPPNGGQTQQAPRDGTIARGETPRAPVTVPATAGVTEPIVTPPTARQPPITETPRVSAVSASRGTTSRATDRAIGAAAFVPAENATTDIEPLMTITPIEVAPVAQRPLTTEDIAMRPLPAIAEVSIAPLSPPERRN